MVAPRTGRRPLRLPLHLGRTYTVFRDRRRHQPPGEEALSISEQTLRANAVANAVGLKDQLGLPTPGQYPLDFAAQYPEVDGIVKLTASANPLFPLDRTARRHRSPSVSQPSRAVYRPTCVTPSRGHRLLTAHVPQRGYTGRQTFCPQVTKYRLIDTHQRRGATS